MDDGTWSESAVAEYYHYHRYRVVDWTGGTTCAVGFAFAMLGVVLASIGCGPHGRIACGARRGHDGTAALELAAGSACANRLLAERLMQAAADLRQGRIVDLTAALTACGVRGDVLEIVRVGENIG